MIKLGKYRTHSYPFTYNLSGSVPYNDNGTWKYDAAFKEIPFNMTVNIQYNTTLVGSGITLPSNVTVNITLPDGQSAEEVVPINATGAGEYTFTDLSSSTPGTVNITVTDTTNNIVQVLNEPEIYDWGINFQTVTITPHAYDRVPFNITGTIYDFTHLGTNNTYTLGLNTTVNVSVENYSVIINIVNGTGSFALSNVTLPAGAYNLSAAHTEYTPNTTYQFNVEPWNINVTPSIMCSNGLSCNDFYVGLNQTLTLSVTYPLSPYYNLTSTANYSVLLNGVEMYNGTINIANNTGSVEVPVNFPENGTVIVKVWDETYHPEAVNSTPLQVANWDMGGSYQVVQYPRSYNTPDTKFYVGVPANLTLGILYNEPCPANSTVNITLQLPNGSVLNYSTVISNTNSTTFSVPQTFLFTEPGFVRVTYADDLGHNYTFSIPVKDWGIFVSASPEEITQNESVNLNVFVAESLYFTNPGERNVTVTLQLPGGYSDSKNLTLEANGGYHGVMTFVNVTPQMPGIAWVTVTDVLSGKTVKIPVKVNAAITPGNKWIDVKVTPANEPVYAYIGNSLKIELQYMYSDGIAAYKDYNDHTVNVTITDAGGAVYSLQLPVDNGYLLIPSYAIPVNGTNPIAVSVVDSYNSSITGGAVVPVTPWNVTFDFDTNGTVWKYVDNELYVTVHVNGPNVPVDIYKLDAVAGPSWDNNVHNGETIEVGIYLDRPFTYPVKAFYNGHQVGSGNYTVTPKDWNATIAYGTNGTLWKYVDNTLIVSAEPANGVPLSSSDLELDVTTNYGSNTSFGQVEIPIIDPMNDITGTAEVYFYGHQKSGSPVQRFLINVTPISVQYKEWNVTFDPVAYDWNTGILALYQKFNVGLNVTVHVNGPNVPVNVTFDNFQWGTNVNDGQTLSGLGFGSVGPSLPIELAAVYNGHQVGNLTKVYHPLSWSTEVSAPSELYYMPNGYTNRNVKIGVTLNGLPEIITEGYNVTIVLNVTLPNGTSIVKVANGTNSTVFNLGDLTFSENGSVNYTVKAYKHDPWSGLQIIDHKEGQIPVTALALDAYLTPGVAYVNVPFDLKVNVTSISSEPNITVAISGTNYTTHSMEAGVLTIPGIIIIHPGIYNVTISDSSINTTITRTLEVRAWHIEVTPVPDNITAGTVSNVTFNVKLVDSMGDIANVTEDVHLALNFNNASVIPNGFYVWTVPVSAGEGSLSVDVFAPVAGYFQLVATDMYGNNNDTQRLIVNEPNPADLTYVYVNIRKEGSLESPGVPVKLYWGFEMGGTKKYFQVYGAQYNADYSEAVFSLYPQRPFDLYIIAVPNSTARDYPILVEGENYNWSVNISNVNKTWMNTTKNVSVTQVSNGWKVTVNVSKCEYNFVNITKEIYTLRVTNVPGRIHIVPGSASVQGNAIFSGVTSTLWESPDNGLHKTSLGSAVNSTVIKIFPDDLKLSLVDNTTLKPTQAGEYFTFKAMLSITNAEGQFDSQWMPFESWIQAIGFLNDTEKNEITSSILAQIGNVSAINGPVANATLDFHIDNSNIAYLDPTNATTDENGTAMFGVYSKALANMTPEELEQLMGTITAWVTYNNLSSNSITVEFGGTGSISGDITDNSGMQIPGVTVTLEKWNGSAWVPAKSFNGSIIQTTSAEDGHYVLTDVPASVEGTVYRVVATYDGKMGYSEDVTVEPFKTSTADVRIPTYIQGVWDYGVFRNGVWIIHETPYVQKHYLDWGKQGDVPVVGDFDGDGKLDYGVFRDGVWIIHFSSDGKKHYLDWGKQGDVPVIWGI